VAFVELMRLKGVSVVCVDNMGNLRPVKDLANIKHVMARNGNDKHPRLDVEDTIFREGPLDCFQEIVDLSL
jgi:hypothetical protein